ncbi:MAG: UDP-N-acetylmuramoyl-L-alanine--D-glutamate ligase [Actinomycetaceae bacterium]|nr:UDP-N-acetylmuramoyl-L-alanine--D-glutamate ligase [Actinomycetaceae bacterium]
MSDWLQSRIAVIGLGKSGRAAFDALVELGASPVGFDRAEPADFEPFGANPAQFVIGTDEAQAEAIRAGGFDLVVVSPGVPPHSPAFAAASALEIEIWGEVELAWQIQQHLGKQISWLTVTGTNGKTTTVGILGSILEAAGIPSAVVGNVGNPIVSTIMHEDVAALAVELSSFQLFTTGSVQPVASVCLNVDADHLEWHGSVDEYVRAKARVYENTSTACVYDANDLTVENMVAQADVIEGARAIGYTMDVPAVSQVGIVEDYFVDRAFVANRHTEALAVAEVSDLSHFAGAHPSTAILKDTLAAITLARALHASDPRFEINEDAVAAGLQNFRPAGHRREVVAENVADMTWIDDSKATNAHAAQASLVGFPPRSVIWIAGGDAKGQDFHDLVRKIKPVLRGVVVIGADPSTVLNALKDEARDVPHVVVDGHEDWMYSVVNEAVALSRPGDTVVLAPASASWDQFKNYAQRGDAFRAAIKKLDEAWQAK